MKKVLLFVTAICCVISTAIAQDALPKDNGTLKYYTEPRYRESESHPLRIAAYILHPIGWVLREGIIRPIDYLISSSETSRSVFGYREPFDYRDSSSCFNTYTDYSDCNKIPPYNYNKGSRIELGHNDTHEQNYAYNENSCENGGCNATAVREIYVPDVNFDFNKRSLNTLGKGKARVIANMLKEKPGVNVVLNGHTDYIGSDSYNKQLGMDRAKAVRDELVSLGVPADRISTVSFGKTRPVLSDNDAPSRAVNRRVEVSF